MKKIIFPLVFLAIIFGTVFWIKSPVEAQITTDEIPKPEMIFGRVTGSKPENMQVGIYVQMPEPYDYSFRVKKKGANGEEPALFLNHYNLVSDLIARGELTLPLQDNSPEHYTDWLYYYDTGVTLGETYTYKVAAMLGARASEEVEYSVTVELQKEPIKIITDYIADYENKTISWEKVCSCLGPVYYKVYRDWTVEIGVSTEDTINNDLLLPNHNYQIEVYTKT